MPASEPVPQDPPGYPLGVLVVNLGTPDAPTPRALRRYLAQFLSDPRVVELPRWLWRPVLHGYVLRVRPARSAALYRRIWTDRGSPLLVHSRDLADAVERQLTARSPGPVTVELAMSYGNPSIGAALAKMAGRNIRRLIVLPLFPQYSGTTSGSVFAAVTRALSARRRIPAFRFIDQYHDLPAYIAALSASVRDFRERHGRGERLLLSFHGLPRRMVDDGDPYLGQCETSARLVAASLGLGDDEWQLTFQSQLGRQEWLKPYTDETLAAWGQSGMGKIDVVCPGFAVDCLETLEEVAIRYKRLYESSGGGELRYIPALNASPGHADLLCGLLAESADGSPAAGGNPDAARPLSTGAAS